jgi:hypothetical protein
MTTPTDWRALCAELLEALENAIRVIYNEDGTKHISTADHVISKADTALAQPEPQGPTDEELWEAYDQMDGAPEDWAWVRDYASAVLARWGRPAVEPVPVAERPWEREGWCDADEKCWWGRPSEELCNSDWFLATRAEVEEFCDCFPPVVSLPHWALPVPTAP